MDKSLVKSVDPMAPKPTPIISIVPPHMKARKHWYREKHSGHWKESQNGPRNIGFQINSEDFSVFGICLNYVNSKDINVK